MSCHFSCPTSCLNTLFTSCGACPSGATLINGACLCTTNWNSACTYNLNFQPIYVGLESFYGVLFPLVMFLYCLRVKLPISYRIVVGLQGLGLLIFTNQIYLYFENQFGLKLLTKSNGYYKFSSRFQSFSLDYAIGAIILFGCFLLGYFTLYYPTKTFRKSYKTYKQYLSDNRWNFLNNFYYFGSRAMFFYIGLWINNQTMDISAFVPLCCFALVVLLVVFKLIHDFHQTNIQNDHVYEAELHLYSMLSSVPMIGLPFVQSYYIYIVIYLVPIGLLLLILILNRNYQIFAKDKCMFYVIEIIISGLTIAFIMISDPYKSYVLIGTICLGVFGISIEMIVRYYSGIDLGRSAKIHPQNEGSQALGEEEIPSTKKLSKAATTKKNYF